MTLACVLQAWHANRDLLVLLRLECRRGHSTVRTVSRSVTVAVQADTIASATMNTSTDSGLQVVHVSRVLFAGRSSILGT